MDSTEREAVRRWAATRSLPEDIAEQLERVVPWIFGVEGYSAGIATDIMAEAMLACGLSEDDVRSLADWLSHATDYDEPPLIPPNRLQALDLIRVAIRPIEGAYLVVPWYAAERLALEVQLPTAAPVPDNVRDAVAKAMTQDRTIAVVKMLSPGGATACEVVCDDA